MSVMKDSHVDELSIQVEELDSKVLYLVNLVKDLSNRLEKIEKFAAKHGVNIDTVTKNGDEQCVVS